MGDRKDPARLAGLTYVQVNTQESFDPALISRFYNGLMKTNFPIEDELEPLEVWLQQLNPEYQASVAEHVYIMNQIIVLDKTQSDEQGFKIAGGISFEYYKEGDSALVTYFVVDPVFRRIGLVTELLRRATEILNAQARSLGRPPLASVLAETNKAGVEDGVMVSTVRHEIQSRLGFCRLNFNYIQPPLSEEQEPCSELLLLVWQPNMPEDQQQLKEGRLPAKVVRDWYVGFCHALMGYETDPQDYEKEDWYLATMKSIDDCESEGILWQACTPWNEKEEKEESRSKGFCANDLCWQDAVSVCANCAQETCERCQLKGSPSDPCTISNFEDFRLSSLHMALTPNFGTKVLTGYVDIVGRVGGSKQVVLDTRTLHIKRVTLGDHVLHFDLQHHPTSPDTFGSGLVIELPLTTFPGDTVTLRVEYETTPASEAAQWLEPSQTSGKQFPFLFTQCQAIHARSLVPCQDTPSVKVPYTAEITVRSPLVVLMSAISTKTIENDDGTRTFFFEQKVPISSYLIALAVGELESRELGPRSRVWAEREVIDAAAFEFADTETFLKTAENICGSPYAWGRYDILVLPPSFPYGGMENPCLTFATPTLLAGDRSLADVIAHEIAHSWMGNLVTNANWEHFWLNEGWTVYVERRILQNLHGRDARDCSATSGQVGLAETLTQLGTNNRLTQMIPCLVNTDPDEAFSRVPYEKGYNLISYLEHLVGAEAFEGFVHAYVKKFEFRSLTTADFVELFCAFFPSAPRVDWGSWLLSTGKPPLLAASHSKYIVESKELCDLWSRCGRASSEEFAASLEAVKASRFRWEEMSAAHQKIPFLDFVSSTIEAEGRWEPMCLQAMDDLYRLSSNNNAEIKFRWQSISLACGQTAIIPHVEAFVATQGRMKFIRPLYRALFKVDKEQARTIFAKNKDSYHPIAAKMVAKDLDIK